MVNHRIHYSVAYNLTAINGHVPVSVFNESTGYERLGCETCDWVGRSYKGRWRTKVDETWRQHAGDIAMGRTDNEEQR